MGAMKTLPLPRFAWLQTRALWLVLALSVTGLVAPAHALRIKEVASVQGVRSNQLSGYGLVVGLDGTGDQSTQMPFTAQAMANYLQQMGISLPPGTSAPQLKNVATVVITAQLPAFAQPGQNIDVAVSSIGNAKSLRGGTLIAAPLRGADGEIYALAQGNVVVGGAGASAGGSKVAVNHLGPIRIVEDSLEQETRLLRRPASGLVQTHGAGQGTVRGNELLNRCFVTRASELSKQVAQGVYGSFHE